MVLDSQPLDLETPRVFVPLLEDHRYKGAYGGRGSAKSHFFADLLIEDHLADLSMRSVCIREVQKSLDQSVKQLLEDKIRKYRLQHYFRPMDTHIRTKGGGLILFQGMQNHTADSIKSLEGFKRAWVEEAHTLSKRSWTLLYPTIRAPGSQVWASWNPDKPTDAVDEFFRSDDKHPDAIAVEANYNDNPWFWDTPLAADVEYDKRRDPDRYTNVWLGGYTKNSEARVFRNWRIANPGEIPPRDKVKRWRYGLDFGFSVDPTAGIEFFIVGRTLYITREAVAHFVDIMDLPAFLDRGFGSAARRWKMVADSSRPESISHLRKHGYPLVSKSRKGAGSVDEGVEFLKSYDIVVSPDCPYTIDELSFYSYKVDPKTGEVLPILVDARNHVIDALRYGVEDIRKPKAGVF